MLVEELHRFLNLKREQKRIVSISDYLAPSLITSYEGWPIAFVIGIDCDVKTFPKREF